MNRSEQTGFNAPRQGTMLRINRDGKIVNDIKAIEHYPPPEFLTNIQRSLWVAALSDLRSEFFKARHIPLMVQYVRAVELMMDASREVMEQPDNKRKITLWMRYIAIVTKLEKFLSLDTATLIAMRMRARAEMRLEHEKESSEEMADAQDNARRGLTYVPR